MSIKTNIMEVGGQLYTEIFMKILNMSEISAKFVFRVDYQKERRIGDSKEIVDGHQNSN